MTSKKLIRVTLFSAILCLSTAWGAIAVAQDSRASLPDLSPEQIVQDVKITFDNRAGTQEYAAPTFDPFESRSDIAGSASLRTVTRAVSIDGQDLQDGAILDLAFYYNQIGDNPHADRGFETIVFLSGSTAANVLRDSRALECATDVQRTVFDDSFHYNAGFFHPYGHYYGHRRFGHRSYGRRLYRHNRGFGRRDYGHRGFGHDRFGGWRRRDGRIVGGGRGRGRGFERNRNDRRFDNDARSDDRRDEARSNRISREEAKRRNGRVAGTPVKENRFERNQNGEQAGERRRNRNRAAGNRGNRPDRSRNRPNRTSRGNIERNNNRDRNRERRRNARIDDNRDNEVQNNEAARRDVITRNSGPKSRRRVATQPTRQRPSTESQTNSNQSSSPQTARPQSERSQRAARSERRSNERNANRSNANRSRSRDNRSQPKRSRLPKNTRPRNIPKRRSAPARRNKIHKPDRLNFFPNDFVGNYRNGGPNVITSVRTDCTREELLSVHIPAERLEAARFDGLTVLAIDRNGEELPVFIPANYIEGLRLATSGQYDAQLTRLDGRPSLSEAPTQRVNPPQSIPQQSIPSRTTPNGIIASCPAGSVYQLNDGTCLLTPTGQNGAYPLP